MPPIGKKPLQIKVQHDQSAATLKIAPQSKPSMTEQPVVIWRVFECVVHLEQAIHHAENGCGIRPHEFKGEVGPKLDAALYNLRELLKLYKAHWNQMENERG